MDKATESYIDAIYYHEMYKSVARWKTISEVKRELKKLKSKTAKLNALKENIRMRVIGFGWKDFATPWSKNGEEFTALYLTSHLEKIIIYEGRNKIPKKPPVELPKRKELPILGTKTQVLTNLDSTYDKNTSVFEKMLIQ